MNQVCIPHFHITCNIWTIAMPFKSDFTFTISVKDIFFQLIKVKIRK